MNERMCSNRIWVIEHSWVVSDDLMQGVIDSSCYAWFHRLAFDNNINNNTTALSPLDNSRDEKGVVNDDDSDYEKSCS